MESFGVWAAAFGLPVDRGNGGLAALAVAFVASGMAALIVICIEAAFGQMGTGRLWTFGKGWAIALAPALAVALYPKKALAAALGGVGILFGIIWWYAKIGSRPMVSRIQPFAQALFGAHYPLLVCIAIVLALILRARLGSKP